MAVLAEGQAPERIDWWWADPGAPLLPMSPFGSNNWSRPYTQVGGVGEVVGSPRPWRSGAKPAGACGGGLVSTPCHPTPIADPLYATLTLGSQSLTFPIVHVPLSAPDLWQGQGSGIGACPLYRVELRCEEVILPGPAIGWQWDLRLYGGTGSVTDALDSSVPVGVGGPGLALSMACPNVLAGCGALGAESASLVVTEEPPLRIRLV